MEKCCEISLRSIRKMKNLKEALKEINPRPVGVDGISRVGYKDPIGSLRWDPNILNISPQLNPLQSLQEELAFGWNPDPTERIRVGGRDLERGTVANRVLERAVARKLSQFLDSRFCDSSYGYRPGRSPELAILRVRDLIRKGLYWALKTDIEHFFEHIQLDVLVPLLYESIADQSLCEVIRGAVSPVRVMNGRSFQRRNGLPQGNGIAPFLSNLYMDGCDRACADLHSFRFSDDLLVMAHSKQEAGQARDRLNRLVERVGLHTNVKKTRVLDVRFEPLVFLGYEVRGGNIHPPQKAIHQLEQNLIKFRGQAERGQALMRSFVHRFRIGPVRKELRRLDRKLYRLFPPGPSLVALFDAMCGLSGSRITTTNTASTLTISSTVLTEIRHSQGAGCHLAIEKAARQAPAIAATGGSDEPNITVPSPPGTISDFKEAL